MKNNETGEYELVVGNKQLLSGFFIVVVLCAVAFAMGYVVGQNSPRTAKLAADQTPAAGSQDARPQPASPALPSSTPPAPQPAAASPPPAENSDAAGPAAATPPPQPTTQPAHDAGPAPAPAPAGASPADAPPGTCWQVLSTRNEDAARVLLQTLKDKGFPVGFSPGPNGFTRVVVGPYTDTTAMARAKTALEKAGLQPIRK